MSEKRFDNDGGHSRVKRFVMSLHGRIVSALTSVALLLPICSLMFPAQSVAQSIDGPLQTLPAWAVVPFNDKSDNPMAGMNASTLASESLINELSRTGRYDVQPSEAVDRVMQRIGATLPITDQRQLVRIGQELRVTSIVSGEVVNYRVVTLKDGSKRADAIMRVMVWDVAAGTVVNGAALASSSGVRPGDTSAETLVNEAFATGAANAISAIRQNTLPTATVLNTTDKQVLINQGARTGFSNGQEVIILRGREQVAAGKISAVEPDKAFVSIGRSFKGVKPGDKVRAVFSVPILSPRFTNDGGSKVISSGRKGSNSGLVTALLVLGAAAMLFTGPGSNSSQNITGVTAEATLVSASPNDLPAVKVSWKTDAFVKGNRTRVAFQIWRDDVVDSPIFVAPGSLGSIIDRGDIQTTGIDTTSPVGGFSCDATASLPDGSGTVGAPLQSGRSYRYSVDLVYQVSSLDLPGGSSGGTTGTTGTTAGGTTGGNTGGNTGGVTNGGSFAAFDQEFGQSIGRQVGGNTGGNTGGTTSGNAQTCYFRTEKAVAKGVATPLARVENRAPSNDQQINLAPIFRFTSVRGGSVGITLEYALQLSPDPNFPSAQTQTVVTFTDTVGTGTLSTPAVPRALTAFPGVQAIYWRVGVKCVADNPGPVVSGGARYMFGAPWRYQRPILPPAP